MGPVGTGVSSRRQWRYREAGRQTRNLSHACRRADLWQGCAMTTPESSDDPLDAMRRAGDVAEKTDREFGMSYSS
jgi:hypothetical protein